MAVTKAIADENRVRILLALRGQELCVCQLIELLGLAPSTVSKHIAILKSAGFISSRKEGRWVFYRIEEMEAPAAAGAAVHWLSESLSADKRILEDRARLREILKIDREQLCKMQQTS